MNLNKFTKAELIRFMEADRAALNKARAKFWEDTADMRQELADTKEELELCKGDAAESLEQHVEPLTIAITDFEARLEFEAAFGDLSTEALGLVKDLFRHVSAAADNILPTSLRH